MKHNRSKWLITGLVFVLVGGGVSVGAAAIIHEKNMAGINLAMDKYTATELASEKETVLSEDEVATGAAVKETAKPTSKPKNENSVAKEDTSSYKLNLVYDRLGMAAVKSYLNVRKKPGTSSKIVGKMNRNSGCNIYKIKNGWAKIVSGNVRGWVKAKYLIKDKEAEAKARKVATLRITVSTETLNVRYLPSTEARVYDQISVKDEYDIERRNLTKEWINLYIDHHIKKSEQKKTDMDALYEDLDNWMCISIDNEKAFVKKDFVKVTYNLDRAVSIKEDARGKVGNSKKGGSSSTASSLINYAMQFLGNPYVWGGTSLTNGTDCSGFTMGVYSHFGYGLPRTSSAQAASLPSVSSSDVRPGDLFFYGSGGVSHVAIYIGNGQIIHASNARTGIKISYAYYRTPIKIGRVIR